MSEYSLSIKNSSGAAANVAIYQNYPNLAQGLPLVWILKNINNNNTTTFAWETTWALNWGTSKQPLAPGIMFTSGGTPQPVEPNTTGGDNMMKISYSGGDFQSGAPYYNKEIPRGSMQVRTDESFTVKQSANMSISVYMNGKPTFAMQGRPNGLYQFDTHPTYYVCTTFVKEGVAVSGTYVSSPKEIEFKEGITDLSYELTDTNRFIPI